MTNFLTYWIKSGMGSDKEREAELSAHFTKVRFIRCTVEIAVTDFGAKLIKGSDTLRKRWDEPMFGAGYWNTKQMNKVSKGRHAEANSLPLTMYDQALADMQAAREDAAAASSSAK